MIEMADRLQKELAQRDHACFGVDGDTLPRIRWLPAQHGFHVSAQSYEKCRFIGQYQVLVADAGWVVPFIHANKQGLIQCNDPFDAVGEKDFGSSQVGDQLEATPFAGYGSHTGLVVGDSGQCLTEQGDPIDILFNQSGYGQGLIVALHCLHVS
jgi:hypothetical protein